DAEADKLSGDLRALKVVAQCARFETQLITLETELPARARVVAPIDGQNALVSLADPGINEVHRINVASTSSVPIIRVHAFTAIAAPYPAQPMLTAGFQTSSGELWLGDKVGRLWRGHFDLGSDTLDLTFSATVSPDLMQVNVIGTPPEGSLDDLFTLDSRHN